MKRFSFLLFLVTVSILANAQNNYVTNQLLVMMNGPQNLEEITTRFNQTHVEVKLQVERLISKRAHVYLLTFDSTRNTVKGLISLLKTDERFAFVQPNHTNIQLRSTIPNDLDYPVQWSLGSTATGKIFAPQAWDITTDGITQNGDTIVMAVVDGGVDTNHIDLNLFRNVHEIPNNGIDDDSNGYIDDYHGWNAYSHSGDITSDPHGTHIAGIIGANTNNSEGVAGIVWGGKILAISGSSNMESVVIEAYGYALELRSKYNESNGDSGAFVVATNSSFGIDRQHPIDFPIWCAFYDSLGAAGILNVAATSNAGINVDIEGDIPTTCPSKYLVSVAMINSFGNPLGGYGPTQIQLSAPGADIRSTTPGHNYQYMTGTSMAAPHVTGVIGAMYSAICGMNLDSALQQPDSLALWIKKGILTSVDSVDNLIGKNATNGRLNMFKAVNYAQLNGPGITHTIDQPTNNSTFDGNIHTQVNGGIAPYSYVWNTGDTTSALFNIKAGKYQINVTENSGCKQSLEVDLFTLGVNELSFINEFIVAPQPNNGHFKIEFKEALLEVSNIQIYNANGKLVFQQGCSALSKEIIVDTQLSAGLYFLKIENHQPQKLVIK